MIPHQIIEDCEPILSKSLSLIKEGNHAYARVLFINDATEKNKKIIDIFLKKKIVGNKVYHTQNIGIVGETAGDTPKTLISYSGLVNSRKSMVNVNLVQNVQNTKNM